MGIQTDDGEVAQNRVDKAEVFAAFYEKLYTSTRPGRREDTYKQTGETLVSPFTMKELGVAIAAMRKARQRTTKA